jgi:hypothetical protein
VLPEDASATERVILFDVIKSLDGYGVKAGRAGRREKWCVKDPKSAAEQVYKWVEEAAPPPPLPAIQPDPPAPRQAPTKPRRGKKRGKSGVSVEVRLPRVFKRLAGASPRSVAPAAVARLLTMYNGQPPPRPDLPRPLFPNVVTLSPAVYEALRERAEEWGWGVEEVLQTALWLYATGKP